MHTSERLSVTRLVRRLLIYFQGIVDDLIFSLILSLAPQVIPITGTIGLPSKPYWRQYACLQLLPCHHTFPCMQDDKAC